jgi:hypothetical protein
MHHAEVDLADLGGIVIDQAGRPRVEFALDRKLLADLAFYGVLKRLKSKLIQSKKRFILVIDMAADADGAFGDEALLAGLLAAHIMQDAFPVGDDDVRDDLLERRICFRLCAGHEGVVLFFKNNRQIAAHLRAESLKDSELLKQRTGENQHIFICNSHIGGRIAETKTGSQNLEKETALSASARRRPDGAANFAL